MKWSLVRNTFAVLLAFAVLIGVIRYFSHDLEQPNTIRISSWGDPQENSILQGLIVEFQKQHPGLHVRLERVDFTDYVDKLITMFSGGLAPDVIFVSAEHLADFYSRGLLESLTPYVNHDPTVKLKDFYPVLVNWYTVHGNLYVMPRDIAPVCVIYYNKKAFDEVGLKYPSDDWTVDEFLKDAIKLTKRDAKGNVTQWGYVDDFPLPENWIYAFGGRFVDDPHHPTRYKIDDPAFIRGVQFRGDLMNKYKVMPGLSNLAQQGSIGTSDLFLNGNAALFVSGIWKVPYLRAIKNFDWDVVMQPRVKGVPRAVVGGSSGYGIVSTSQHKMEAWQLISFLSGPEGQKRFAATGLIQPALKTVAESPAFLDGQVPRNKKMLLKAVAYGVDDPIATNWREVKQGILFPELDKVWTGSETAAEAVAKVSVKLKDHPLVFEEKPN